MDRKTVSLRWKAARKYNGLEDTPALRAILPDVWEFLERLIEGLAVGKLPMGHPTLKRISSREGVIVIYAIGRPAPTDPDRHARLFHRGFLARRGFELELKHLRGAPGTRGNNEFQRKRQTSEIPHPATSPSEQTSEGLGAGD